MDNDTIKNLVYIAIGAVISILSFVAKGVIEKQKLINGILFGYLNVWYIVRYSAATLSPRFQQSLKQAFQKALGKEATEQIYNAEAEDQFKFMQIQMVQSIYIDHLKGIEGALGGKIDKFARYYPVEAFEIFGSSEISRHIDDLKANFERFIDLNSKRKRNGDVELTFSKDEFEEFYSYITRTFNETIATDIEQTIRMLAWKSSTLNYIKVRRKLSKTNKKFVVGYNEVAEVFISRFVELVQNELDEKKKQISSEKERHA